MTLEEFLQDTRAEVQSMISERMPNGGGGGPYPHAESVFAEIVMDHMSEIGMTFDPQVCHFSARLGNAVLKLSGFAVSDERDELDLFVSLYEGAETVVNIPDADTLKAAKQCVRFLESCASGELARQIDQANDAYMLALTVKEIYQGLDRIRIFVITDRKAKAKSFSNGVVAGKTVALEVMDIERLHLHRSAGKPRDEIIVNFSADSGGALPCVYVLGGEAGYDYALTAIPGEAVRSIYEKYGSRVIEANVRSFLSVTAKVNKGIRDTLRVKPELFMAYNNGLVIVADEIALEVGPDGAPRMAGLKGLQIVNGGQTTASIYFTKKGNPETDLSRVWVPAKIIVLNSGAGSTEEALIADISRFANSQTAVKQSDLSANHPFHIEIERLAETTVCPDGVGRWFYERAAGSYQTMFAQERAAPARLQRLKAAIPPSRKISKTDLARYLHAWEQRPDLVSLGPQKNFEKFRVAMASDADGGRALPDAHSFKAMIAKAILFKGVSSLVRPMFKNFGANVSAYLVALVANRYGARVDLNRIWLAQGLSKGLSSQLQTWALEVYQVIDRSRGGEIFSEWAKRPRCWEVVAAADYSPEQTGIPEFRG